MGYYVGDPGFLSGLGKVFGGVASFLPGVGGILGKVISGVSHAGERAAPVLKKMGQHPVLTAAGGAAVSGAVGAGVSQGITRMHMGGPGAHGRYAAAGTRGYHPIKKGPHAGLWTRNRRMRSTNPRALRRALRRAKSFEHLARRVIRLTSPRSHGRATFKFRRRKK